MAIGKYEPVGFQDSMTSYKGVVKVCVQKYKLKIKGFGTI